MRRHARGMMRAAERPLRGQRAAFDRAGDGSDHGDFQQLRWRQWRQDRRKPRRQHRLARTGRADHQHVVSSMAIRDGSSFSQPTVLAGPSNPGFKKSRLKLRAAAEVTGSVRIFLVPLEPPKSPEYRCQEVQRVTVRIIASCALALLATAAQAESPVIVIDPKISYSYTYETLGSRHFCDLATVIAKWPMLIKLTAASITDDTKPKDHDLIVAYVVEAFTFGAAEGSDKPEPKQVKVVSGKIISNIFRSDLQATKEVKPGLGASYQISLDRALALFMSVISVIGKYALAVEFEKNFSAVFRVQPTPELLDAATKWHQCSLDIVEHRSPQ